MNDIACADKGKGEKPWCPYCRCLEENTTYNDDEDDIHQKESSDKIEDVFEKLSTEFQEYTIHGLALAVHRVHPCGYTIAKYCNFTSILGCKP
jgi:hypothetical protein